MGLFDKFKKKQSVFIHDDKNDGFYAELNGVKFVCEKIEDKDLDSSVIVYCEQTLDDVHIISVEFGGLFTDFYYASIDG